MQVAMKNAPNFLMPFFSVHLSFFVYQRSAEKARLTSCCQEKNKKREQRKICPRSRDSTYALPYVGITRIRLKGRSHTTSSQQTFVSSPVFLKYTTFNQNLSIYGNYFFLKNFLKIPILCVDFVA